MEAEQFVIRFGLDKAREFSQITIKGLRQEYCFEINTGESVGLAYVDLDDIKRIVKSFDLVQSSGGLNAAKLLVHSANKLSYQLEQFKLPIDENAQKDVLRLEQAIRDVELCQ